MCYKTIKKLRMKKTYQPVVIELSEKFIILLTNELNFFIDEEITSTDYAQEHFCDKLTEKFIKNGLSADDDIHYIFDENEFIEILNNIVIENTLKGLMSKGLINTFEDLDGNEILFLTEDGKNVAKTL